MNINIQQLEGLEISKYIIFDIRDNIAYMHGYIPGALNVKPEDVEEEAKKYRDKLLSAVKWDKSAKKWQKIFVRRATMHTI